MEHPDLLIKMRDARRVGYCARGVRSFFERYGLDYQEFLTRGTRAADLYATGDKMAIAVVDSAIKVRCHG